MSTYFLKRLLMIVPTLLLVAVTMFVVMRLVPGDPVTMMLGDIGILDERDDAQGGATVYALEWIDLVDFLNQSWPVGLAVVAHLVECERAADHVAGEALSALGIGFPASPSDCA
jgi:ABC-type microcin C transport system permease subunit YejB